MNNSKHELLSHNEELDINVSSLKALAKDLDVPIIALSQLCRNVDKKTEPNISDLLIYGDIEKYFDTVIFVGDRAKNNCEFSKTEIIIAKNNNGNTGSVNLRFDKSTGSFNEFDEWIIKNYNIPYEDDGEGIDYDYYFDRIESNNCNQYTEINDYKWYWIYY